MVKTTRNFVHEGLFFFRIFKTRKNFELPIRGFFLYYCNVCFVLNIHFFSCPRGSGGFLLKKSCKLTIGTSSFCRNLFPEEWSEKKMVFYIRKTNAIIWYNHLLYQNSKEKSILEKVGFSLNVTFFKNCLQIREFFFSTIKTKKKCIDGKIK